MADSKQQSVTIEVDGAGNVITATVGAVECDIVCTNPQGTEHVLTQKQLDDLVLENAAEYTNNDVLTAEEKLLPVVEQPAQTVLTTRKIVRAQATMATNDGEYWFRWLNWNSGKPKWRVTPQP